MAITLYDGDIGVTFTPHSDTDSGVLETFYTYGHLNIDFVPQSLIQRLHYPDDWFAEVFEVERGGEQPQISITYQIPLARDVEKLRVVRRAYTYPVNEDDGDIILEDTDLLEGELYYSDLNVEPFVPYFYICFSYVDGGWISGNKVKKSAITYQGNYFPDKIWNQMPRNEHVKDASGPNAVTTILEPTESLGKTYNITETTTAKGQLQRFFKLIGLELDDVKGLIDLMYLNMRNPEKSTEEVLPYIAAIVGLSLNREFSVDRQRREILDAVGLYKIKGTPLGFTAAARLITTIRQIELVEYKDFLLCSNNTERLSARTITDYPWLYLDEHGVYDPFKIVNARSWSDIFNPYTFELRLFVSDTDVVTSTVLSKIERVMDSFSPVCTTGFVTVFPTAIEEDIDLIVTDSYTDVITDYGDVEDIEIGFDSSSYYMHFSPFNVFDINSTVSGTKTINVTGDVTGTLTPGMAVTINGAPTSGVDGIYTVVSRVYNGPDSDIVISENIADSTNEGSLAYGPAPVNFTNSYTARSAFSYYLRIIDIGNTIASTKTIEVTGDYGSIVAAGHVIEVRGAPTAGVNGYYTVVSATYVAGPNRTDIVVQENIPDSTSEGDVYYGVFGSELWWDVITSVEGEETGMTEVVSVLGVN